MLQTVTRSTVRCVLWVMVAVCVGVSCSVSAGREQVAGQIFIVDNQTPVRLSLVDIYAIDRPQAKEILRSMKQRRDATVPDRELELEQAKAKLKECLEVELPQARKHSETMAFLALAKAKLLRDLVESCEKLADYARTISKYAKEEVEAKHLARVAISDVDGKFTINSPAGEAVLFAHAVRTVNDRGKYYCWLITIKSNDRLVMLTNKNTIDAPDAEKFDE